MKKILHATSLPMQLQRMNRSTDAKGPMAQLVVSPLTRKAKKINLDTPM